MKLPLAFYLLEVLDAAMQSPNTAVARRSHKRDKEFFFQEWVEDKLEKATQRFMHSQGMQTVVEKRGRNSFPDYVIVPLQEYYEVKGLAHPGRNSFDANSRLPKGGFEGGNMYYVFGRYLKDAVEQGSLEIPIYDIAVVHGAFFNVDDSYTHKNLSVKGFGSYGDILIRDRKMYVPPTPYAIWPGLESHVTLIVPDFYSIDRLCEIYPQEKLQDRFIEVAKIPRVEVSEKIIAYRVNLYEGTVDSYKERNPKASKEYSFRAIRVRK